MNVVVIMLNGSACMKTCRPFWPTLWGRKKPRCTRWSPPTRCSPMVANGWSRRWLTVCRTGTAAPFTSTTSASVTIVTAHAGSRARPARRVQPRTRDGPCHRLSADIDDEGCCDAGTARKTVNLSVPTAGKTGTTNDAKDVWFVGFTSNIVAGCYIGYDQPRSLGRGASGGGMCGPVFQRFMSKAVQKYGGGKFRAPDGCEFIKIDRFTGARLSSGASGDNVVSECFREGEFIDFGMTFDGGFAMGADLPLVEEVGGTNTRRSPPHRVKRRLWAKGGFGTLSSGGLY